MPTRDHDRIHRQTHHHSHQKTFEEVTAALEGLFQQVDGKRLADMTTAGDQAGI